MHALWVSEHPPRRTHIFQGRLPLKILQNPSGFLKMCVEMNTHQCVKWTPTCVWDEHQPVFRDEHQPVCKDEHPSVCVDEHSAVGYDRQNYWLTDKQFYIKGELKICSLPFSYFLMCSSNSVFGPQLPCLRGEKWMVKYSGDSNQAKIFQMYFMRLFFKRKIIFHVRILQWLYWALLSILIKLG